MASSARETLAIVSGSDMTIEISSGKPLSELTVVEANNNNDAVDSKFLQDNIGDQNDGDHADGDDEEDDKEDDDRDDEDREANDNDHYDGVLEES